MQNAKLRAVNESLQLSACRKKHFRQAVRLVRMLQDALFFAPKAYDGTPRGRKKGKYMKKSGEIRCFAGFSFLYLFKFYIGFFFLLSLHICSCDFIDSLNRWMTVKVIQRLFFSVGLNCGYIYDCNRKKQSCLLFLSDIQIVLADEADIPFHK